MKNILPLLFLFIVIKTSAQDFQVSAMNGYSVDMPFFDIANGNVYLVYGTNYKFYKFPVNGPSAPIANPVIPDPSNWGPYNTDIAAYQNQLVSIFIDYKNSQFELRSVQSSDEGTNWSSVNILDTVEFGSSLSMRVDIPRVIISEKGKTYITWFNFLNSRDTASLNLTPYGGTKRRIDLPNGTDYEHCFSIYIKTINNTDNIFVTYAHDNKFFLRISTDEGNTFSEPKLIKDVGFSFINYQDFSHVIVDETGKIYVAYQYFNSGGTRLTVSTDNGSSWSNPVPIDNEGYHFVGLKMTPNKTLVKYYVTNGDLFVESSMNGNIWSTPSKVNTTTGTVTGDFGYPSYLNAKVIDDNYIALAWVDSRTGNDEIFYSKAAIPPPPVVSVNEENIVTKFLLEQNFPNPFNPSTKIKFTVPSDQNGNKMMQTKLTVFNLLGKEVAVLVNELKSGGVYEAEFSGAYLPSGVYFYKLEIGGYIDIKKMVLLK